MNDDLYILLLKATSCQIKSTTFSRPRSVTASLVMATSGRLPGDFWPRAPGFVPPGAVSENSQSEVERLSSPELECLDGDFKDDGADEPEGDLDSMKRPAASGKAEVKSPMKRPSGARPSRAGMKKTKALTLTVEPKANAKAKDKTTKAKGVTGEPKAKAKAKAKTTKAKDVTGEPKAKAKAKAKITKAKTTADKTTTDKTTKVESKANVRAKNTRAKAKAKAKSRSKYVRKARDGPGPDGVGCSKCRFAGCAVCRKKAKEAQAAEQEARAAEEESRAAEDELLADRIDAAEDVE